MKKALILLFLTIFHLTPPIAYGETSEDATRRSGVIIGELDLPAVIAVNQTIQVSAQATSYISNLGFELQVKDGSNELRRQSMNISSNVQGIYSLGQARERHISFSGPLTLNTTGTFRIGIYNFVSTESTFRMYVRIIDSRAAITSPEAKQVSIDVVDEINSWQGQCVNWARNYLVQRGVSQVSLPGLGFDGGASDIPSQWSQLTEVRTLNPGQLGLLVLNSSNSLPWGHVAVVHGGYTLADNTLVLETSESNWGLDERLDITQYFALPNGFRRSNGATIYQGRLFRVDL